MTKEEIPMEYSPKWLLNKIKNAKYDSEALMAILDFQNELSKEVNQEQPTEDNTCRCDNITPYKCKNKVIICLNCGQWPVVMA